MQGINLYHYVTSGQFFSEINCSEHFDVVITDLNLTDSELNVPVFDLGELLYEPDVFLEKNRILIVIGSMTSYYFLDTISGFLSDEANRACVVNCGVGIDSVLQKSELDVKDISSWSDRFNVYEPISKQQLHILVESDENIYIRLLDQFVLVDHGDYYDEDSCTLDMRKMDLFGSNLTIVLGGQYLSYAQILYDACHEVGLSSDVFALARYDQGIKGILESSIESSGKTIFIIDHEKKTLLDQMKKTWGLSKEMKLITPEYNAIQTTMDEYVHEMGSFDAQNIIEQILS